MTDIPASGLTAEQLIDILGNWDTLYAAPLHLIACGDAALALLKFRSVTQDVDLMVPLQAEYELLLKRLPILGFEKTAQGFALEATPDIAWRFWPGRTAFGAQLVESPLDDANHTAVASWQHLSLGILNLSDLMITHIFRSLPADVNDCIAVFKTWKVDAEELLERYAETSEHAENPDDMMRKFMEFVEHLASQQLVSDEVWERIARSGRKEKRVRG